MSYVSRSKVSKTLISMGHPKKFVERAIKIYEVLNVCSHARNTGISYSLENILLIVSTLTKSDQQYKLQQQQQQQQMQMYLSGNILINNKNQSSSLPSSPPTINKYDFNNISSMSLPPPVFSSDEEENQSYDYQNIKQNIVSHSNVRHNVRAAALMLEAMKNKQSKSLKNKRSKSMKKKAIKPWKTGPKSLFQQKSDNNDIMQELAQLKAQESNLSICDSYLPQQSQSMNVLSKFKSNKPSFKQLSNKFRSNKVKYNDRSSSCQNIPLSGQRNAYKNQSGSGELPFLMQSQTSSKVRQMPNYSKTYEYKNNYIDVGTHVTIDSGTVKNYGKTIKTKVDESTLGVLTPSITKSDAPFHHWNYFSILKWLNSMQNEKFLSHVYMHIKQAIKYSKINGKDLLDMNDLTLRLMKIDEESDRLLILENIQQLQKGTTASMDDVNINDCSDEYLCPLSYVVMIDPVILCVTGGYSYTYERRVIEKYINLFHSDPFTQQKIEVQMLVSNVALKNIIHKWKSHRQ